jgi:hypothetical protein
MCGFNVLGIEANPSFAKLAQQRAQQKLMFGSLEIVNGPLTFDNLSLLEGTNTILLLSVHHQFVANMGLEKGNSLLVEIFRRATHQFFFQPACIYPKYGKDMPFIENDYSSIEEYFIHLFKGIRDYTVRPIGLTDNRLPPSEPLRPLLLFEFTKPTLYFNVPSNPLEWSRRQCDIAQVSINRCRSNYWFAFGKDGDHPLQEQVSQLIKSSSSFKAINETVLFQHYSSFQPSSYSDAAAQRTKKSLGEPLANHSCRRYAPFNSQSLLGIGEWANALVSAPEIPDWDQNLLGPQPDTKVLSEIQRLTGLVQSFSKEGYNPELFPDGFVRGYFIERNEEWLFIVTAGMHRMAVMANLGYTSIKVRLQPGSRPLINTQDPLLPPDARSYYDLYFSDPLTSIHQ